MNEREEVNRTSHFAKSQSDRRARFVTIDGITDTIAGWCRRVGKRYGLVKRRVKDGMTIEEAIMKPVKDMTQRSRLRLLSEEAGINWRTVYGRIHYRGWTVERALSTPSIPHDSPDRVGVNAIVVNGEKLTYQGMARRLGFKSLAGFAWRMKNWGKEEAVSTRPLSDRSEAASHMWATRRRKELASIGVIL